MRKKPPHSDAGRHRGPEKTGTRPPSRRPHGPGQQRGRKRRAVVPAALLAGCGSLWASTPYARLYEPNGAERFVSSRRPPQRRGSRQNARLRGIVPQIVAPEDMNRRLGGEAVHQGVMLEAEPLPARDLDGIESKSGVVLVLDQITDPHNVGAIVRTAAAFGVDALVTTERHSPEFTGTLAKAASGGLEHVAIVSVVNLARAPRRARRAWLSADRLGLRRSSVACRCGIGASGRPCARRRRQGGCGG